MTISFRLATFNLENFEVSRGHENEFEHRIEVLRPILKDLAADVLCLQEVDAQKTSRIGARSAPAASLLCLSQSNGMSSSSACTARNPGLVCSAYLAMAGRTLIAEPNRLENRLFLANVTMPVIGW